MSITATSPIAATVADARVSSAEPEGRPDGPMYWTGRTIGSLDITLERQGRFGGASQYQETYPVQLGNQWWSVKGSSLADALRAAHQVRDSVKVPVKEFAIMQTRAGAFWIGTAPRTVSSWQYGSNRRPELGVQRLHGDAVLHRTFTSTHPALKGMLHAGHGKVEWAYRPK